MKNYILPLLLSLLSAVTFSQENDITASLYTTYETYKEKILAKRRIKQEDLQPLLTHYKNVSGFTVSKVGTSIAGRDLSLVSLGTGKTQVFLWSQMHGDEPTATQAIFDILKFLESPDFNDEKDAILTNLTLHFLPMLNPDGAALYQRRNLLGIDINRDALRLQSPEGKTLKRVRDSLKADFGFNLHDQSIYYNAERTRKPATISYLAPAYNYEKDVNEVRANAMKVIVFMNSIIQKYAPGQVAKYNDDFEPRAFGDNIQKWGTSTILIESGGYNNDIEKQEIRKLNYVSILSAIYSIATQNFKNLDITDYEKIPENDRKLFDLKIEGAKYILNNKAYKIDVGINRLEVNTEDYSDFWYSSRILDQGDLSTYYGYETFNAAGYTLKQGKVYPKQIATIKEASHLNFISLLKEGYTHLRISKIPYKQLSSPFPLHIIGSKFIISDKLFLQPGVNPTFLLEKNGKNKYAVINGFLINLENGEGAFKNAMIYR
ncbi:zinc carboxypeptidase [Maribacter vaceletii]|uniref:Zinc carboxypeptidase n=1 Tax=Maribacter vaceletii TaxID=1206816 RepID=A0A495E8P1_9FLAO|nr:M14 metallopeptidase family protein [Maribacter vaceletii]RKR13021.1 zinc carboxypeptidase [Maribacter vaceletii]